MTESKPILLGLSGSAGVGKDTAADYLGRDYGFTKISLADEMKRICKRIYGFTDEQLWGPSEMRNAPDERYRRPDGSFLSPRVALQLLGTEMGRQLYQNTWVDFTLKVAQKVMSGSHSYTRTEGAWFDPLYGVSVVIPDVRFRNEIDAIQAVGGKVVRLKRQTKEDALKIGVVGHASESEQLSIPDGAFDAVLEVPDGHAAYYRVLDDLMKQLDVAKLSNTHSR